MTSCCAACDKFNRETNERRFKKLQSDIQEIADEEFMTIYQISYSKWTIEKIGDRVSGKKFKVHIHYVILKQYSVCFLVDCRISSSTIKGNTSNRTFYT